MLDRKEKETNTGYVHERVTAMGNSGEWGVILLCAFETLYSAYSQSCPTMGKEGGLSTSTLLHD